MADTQIENGAPRTTQREARIALERQVAQLKREINRINKTLADRAEEAAEEASGWYDGASERASKATRALRTQAHSVSEVVKGNPGTVSSAMVLGALIGFVLGMASARWPHDRLQRWF